jgi:hypothetical protein
VFPIVVHTQDDTGSEITTPEDKWDFNGEPRILGGRTASLGQFPYQVKWLRSN